MSSMHVGDLVVFLDHEPELNLPKGTPGTVTAVHGPDDIGFVIPDVRIEFEVADGRIFTTMESSLGRAPTS